MSDWPAYTFLEKAAEEAQAASRRYWAKGGEADRRFPVHEDVFAWWPLAPTGNEVGVAAKTRRGAVWKDDGGG